MATANRVNQQQADDPLHQILPTVAAQPVNPLNLPNRQQTAEYQNQKQRFQQPTKDRAVKLYPIGQPNPR
jgi:hypothetical protein